MITVAVVRVKATMSTIAAPKTTMAAGAKMGGARGPTAEKEAGDITIRAQWMTVEVEESCVRESIGIIIHTGSLEGALGL